MKVCAVAAALACAGGAAIAGHGATSGSVPPPAATASLDHFLCAGDPGAFCVPAKTTLPDGTTFTVGSPQDRLVCTASSGSWRRRGRTVVAPTTVTVANELGAAALVTGMHQWNCSILANEQSDGHFSHARARAHATTVATYSCTSVHYPANPASTFSRPDPLRIGDRSWVRLLDPSQLCTPADAAPAAAVTSAAASADSLLCFRARVAQNRNRFFAPVLSLCVPSTVGGDATPPASTTTTRATTTTTTTAPTTTTSTTRPAGTTTTTHPATTTTTAAPTTTTQPATTTTTLAPTTSTTAHAQPCPGILVNGVCIITV